MGNLKVEQGVEKKNNRPCSKIILILSVLLSVAVIIIVFMVINNKKNVSFLVMQDDDGNMNAYMIDSNNSQYTHKVNLLIGEVSEVYGPYAVLETKKNIAYKFEVMSDRQIQVGDMVFVFYSQPSIEDEWPVNLEEQYGYIKVNGKVLFKD